MPPFDPWFWMKPRTVSSGAWIIVRIGVWGLLAALLCLVYWLLNPADMWTGGRPALMGVMAVVAALAAWALYAGGKRSKS